jgi:hypothetical protein
MEELLKEIRQLNMNIQRIADFLSPVADAAVLDRHRAFRAHTENNRLLLAGIASPDPVRLAELTGIDDIVARLQANTEQFMEGLPCNNVLLYGPRGTGKSSAVKALLNEYGPKGLRIVEIPKNALLHIFEIQEMVRRRPEKYVLFCDDLSFNEDDDSYVPIKTVLEGGLETRPENAIIYATSNRRHLMPERIADNMPVFSDGELQPAETLEEKMSLSDRFGLRLGFEHYSADIYLEIIGNYAKIRKIKISSDELRRSAMEWSLSQGSFSGRAARQFIDDLEGRLKKGRTRRTI